MSIHIFVCESNSSFDGGYTGSTVGMSIAFNGIGERGFHLSMFEAIQSGTDASHIVATQFLLMVAEPCIFTLQSAVCAFVGHYEVEAFLVGDTHILHLFPIEDENVVAFRHR